MSDLSATFDAHTKAEFEDLELEATMVTSTEQAQSLLDQDLSKNRLLGAHS